MGDAPVVARGHDRRPAQLAVELVGDDRGQRPRAGVSVVEQPLADDDARRARRVVRILERPDELRRADGAREVAAVARGPAPVREAGRRRVCIVHHHARGERIGHRPRERELRRRQGGVDHHREVHAARVRRERHERRHVRRREPDPDQRPHTTTITVTSSHATTHSVHATTLAVMPRVTASASGFGAPPFATTSAAMPHA